MLCLYLHQSFSIGLFPLHDPLKHQGDRVLIHHGQVKEPNFCPFISANHYPRLNATDLSHTELEKILIVASTGKTQL